MNSAKGRYSGALSCAIETARNEGFKAFYKGFNASFTRLVGWNICLWITYEQFKRGVMFAYNRH
jgi:solute carrier family 25 uncoupling protein 8/9